MPGPGIGRGLENLLPEPLLLVSAKGEVVDANLAARRLFAPVEKGCHLHELALGASDKLMASLKLWLRSGDLIRGLITLEGAGGERYSTYGARIPPVEDAPGYILVRCHPEKAANLRFIELTRRVNALNREVFRRQQAEDALFAEKELAQVTLQSIGDAVITTDILGRINYLNPVAQALTGWAEEEARGKRLLDVFKIYNELTREPVESPVARVLSQGRIVGLANHTVLIHRDGSEFSIDDSAAPIRDRTGRLIGAVMVFRDVTQARKLADEVSYQASHDGLTGLLNRQTFEQRLRGVLTAPDAAESTHSLLFLDLDQFKVINDTCGHLAGDALLRALGPLLQKQLRHGHCLARLGGDEFGVLLEDCPATMARRIALSLKEVIGGFNFIWEGKPFKVGVSIGQVNFSSRDWALVDLLSAADNACYLAKENGRDRIHLYSSDDLEMAHRFRQTQWVSRIREAFAESRFRLYGQAILPLAGMGRKAETSGAHFEVLLRLHDSDGKLVPPMAFIPAAERYNLMVSIDRWVLETAFAKLGQTGCAHIDTCAINLSGASLGDDAFLGFVYQCFGRFAVPPRVICFEITETEAIANLSNARHIIGALTALGCRFALDDFGSGMSSFGYLKNLPVDYLKIDGAFIRNLANDPIDHAMVAAINDIGHVMGLETIAEFVETPDILPCLRDIGVDYVQGYGVARPRPLEVLLADLSKSAEPIEPGHDQT